MLEIVRVPSFSPAATTIPLPIYHTTTTMSREALRPWNLNVNYLPPPLILSSPPSSPKNIKKQSAKHHIMDNHSGPKLSSSQQPSPPTVVQHQPIILPNVSSLTTEAPPAILNLDDNYSSSDEAYIEPAGSITAGYSAKQRKKTLKKLNQNLPDLPMVPTFDPLQPVVPPDKAWNRLPISFSELDTITPIQIFNLFLTNFNMRQLVANTKSYAQQPLLGPEKERQHSWQPVTAQDLYLWLAIQIYLDLIGVPPERYWIKDGVYHPKDGFPPAAYLGKTHFQEICCFCHVSPYNSPTATSEGLPDWHSKVDILLDKLGFFSQQYCVPGSNVTTDDAMILFTGRSIHITKMPNKPISQEYKFFSMTGKGYVWEFHPSSNVVGGNPVDVESHLLQLTDTGKMVHHLTRCLHQRHRKLFFNVYIDDFFTTQPLLAELCLMGIGACGSGRQQFQGFPKELKVEKNAKLLYHIRSGAVNDGVATLLWMDSLPVAMMSTIHPLSGEDSLVLRLRKHPRNKSTNASGANSTILPGEHQKELDIPVIFDPYNQYKVGVNVADQYQTYFDTQIISRCNWYPLCY
jgi:hypothetical protein